MIIAKLMLMMAVKGKRLAAFDWAIPAPCSTIFTGLATLPTVFWKFRISMANPSVIRRNISWNWLAAIPNTSKGLRAGR